MPGDDVRFAAARRDDGIRTVSRVTWRAGAACVICSAVIAVAFGHHASAAAARPRPGATSGTILVPGQPPAPAPGAGQVTSGAS